MDRLGHLETIEGPLAFWSHASRVFAARFLLEMEVDRSANNTGCIRANRYRFAHRPREGRVLVLERCNRRCPGWFRWRSGRLASDPMRWFWLVPYRRFWLCRR